MFRWGIVGILLWVLFRFSWRTFKGIVKECFVHCSDIVGIQFGYYLGTAGILRGTIGVLRGYCCRSVVILLLCR